MVAAAPIVFETSFARYVISSSPDGVEMHRPVSQLGPLLPRDCGRVGVGGTIAYLPAFPGFML